MRRLLVAVLTSCAFLALGAAASGADSLASGPTWSIQNTPDGNGTKISQLGGVSCTSPAACTAVGFINGQTLAMRWNGSSWSRQATNSPHSGTGGYDLNGVTCTSATACTAVGVYGRWTLALAWNGTTWSRQSTHYLNTGTFSTLNGVSCLSATACTAVGFYADGSESSSPLVASWNGTSWSVQPSPIAMHSELSAVSCTSANACTAVGSDGATTTALTFAETWNGTSWTVQTTPNPAAARQAQLSGVSCTSAKVCIAVGEYWNSAGTPETLAESWNGLRWSVQTTPGQPGYAYLNAVSCASASACTAVGNHLDAGTGDTLAEAWNGTAWSVERTPNRAGDTDNALDGVSCASATACTAVGRDMPSSTTTGPLAEGYSG
jgi:hypothetical protein